MSLVGVGDVARWRTMNCFDGDAGLNGDETTNDAILVDHRHRYRIDSVGKREGRNRQGMAVPMGMPAVELEETEDCMKIAGRESHPMAEES